jgi:hypothetical protein
MSANALEAALHQLSTDRHARTEFKAEPARFLKRFVLNEKEAHAIAQFDVRSLQDMGVSALLTYGFWLTTAEQKNRAAYMAALTNPKEA